MKKICFFFASLLFATLLGGQTTILSENFNAGDPPAGWTNFNNSTGGNPSAAAWTVRPNGYTYSSFWGDRTFHSNDNSSFYLSNSDEQGGETTETITQSPSFSTMGFQYILLQFYHHFREYLTDTGYVEVSTNGTTWTTKAKIFAGEEDSLGAANSFVQKTVSLNAYTNLPTVYIRFRYYAEFGYYWAIDNVVVLGSSSGPLPVSLLTFSGHRETNHNVLQWSTGFEQNNRGFQLERSTDGRIYAPISFITTQAAFGNSNSLLNYSFTDHNLQGDRQYYRLRQVDLDGNEKLSAIILIKGAQPKEFTVDAVFPNPVSTTLNVFINSPQHNNIIIHVINMAGQMVRQKAAITENGSNNIPLDVSSLKSGVYLLKIVSSAGEIGSSRFVKQ